MGYGVIGNTTVSGTVILGSSPGIPALLHRNSTAPSYSGLVRRPLTAVTRVRIPLGSPPRRTPGPHGPGVLRCPGTGSRTVSGAGPGTCYSVRGRSREAADRTGAAPSYSGLVRRPLTAVTRVRIPLGSPRATSPGPHGPGDVVVSPSTRPRGAGARDRPAQPGSSCSGGVAGPVRAHGRHETALWGGGSRPSGPGPCRRSRPAAPGRRRGPRPAVRSRPRPAAWRARGGRTESAPEAGDRRAEGAGAEDATAGEWTWHGTPPGPGCGRAGA